MKNIQEAIEEVVDKFIEISQEAKDWKIVGKEENEIDKNDECCGYCITHKKDDGWGYAHSYTECRLDGDCDCHKEEEEPKGHMKDKLDKQLLELSYKHNNEITLAIDDIIQLIHDYSGYAIDQYIQGNLERRKDND